MKTIKIKCKKPFGALIEKGASKYLEYAVKGADKVLIVADETVFRLYGNSIKKALKPACDKVFTFIYPAGENGTTKHVLDKLLILMTELGIKGTDYVLAFGGRSSAQVAGLACKIFRGGIPYIFVPTTFMGMINPMLDGKVGVDFLGEKKLICQTNFPVACFIDTDYLKTLSPEGMRDGYAEVIRRAMAKDGKLISEMQEGGAEIEQMIFSAIKNSKTQFALPFSAVAEKTCAVGVACDKLTAFGIVTAIDTAMALGVSYGLEENMLALLSKYGIRWDVGLSINKMWAKMSEFNGKKITLILPKKPGKTRTVRLSREKIKDTF